MLYKLTEGQLKGGLIFAFNCFFIDGIFFKQLSV